MASYIELLRDPRWQRKRLEILQRDGWACTGCHDTTKTLNVHHKIYRKGAKPWEYDDTDLITLCEDCHEWESLERAALNKSLAILPTGAIAYVRGYVDALACLVLDGKFFEPDLENYGQIQGAACAIEMPPDDFYAFVLANPGPIDVRPLWIKWRRQSE